MKSCKRSFQEKFVSADVTLNLPFGLLEKLQRATGRKKHGGQYQLLIREILSEWVSSKRAKR